MVVSSPVLGRVCPLFATSAPAVRSPTHRPGRAGQAPAASRRPLDGDGTAARAPTVPPQAHQEDRHGPVLPEHPGWRPGQAGDCPRRRRGPQVRQERGQADASNARSAPSARRRGAGHLPLTAGQLAPTAPPALRRAWWPVRPGGGATHRTPSRRWRRGQGVTNRLRRDLLATLRTKRSSSPSGRAEQRGGQFVTGCRACLLYCYDPTSDSAHSGALSRGATVSR